MFVYPFKSCLDHSWPMDAGIAPRGCMFWWLPGLCLPLLKILPWFCRLALGKVHGTSRNQLFSAHQSSLKDLKSNLLEPSKRPEITLEQLARLSLESRDCSRCCICSAWCCLRPQVRQMLGLNFVSHSSLQSSCRSIHCCMLTILISRIGSFLHVPFPRCKPVNLNCGHSHI